jgi:hypothetical protein
MDDEERLADLLLAWEEAIEQGEDLAADFFLGGNASAKWPSSRTRWKTPAARSRSGCFAVDLLLGRT